MNTDHGCHLSVVPLIYLVLLVKSISRSGKRFSKYICAAEANILLLFLTMRERGWRGGDSSAHTAQLSNFTCDKIPLFCDFPLRGLSNGKVTVCFIHCLLKAADGLSR